MSTEKDEDTFTIVGKNGLTLVQFQVRNGQPWVTNCCMEGQVDDQDWHDLADWIGPA